MAPAAHPESLPASGVPKMGSFRQVWGLATNPALLSAQGTARPTDARVPCQCNQVQAQTLLPPHTAQWEIGANEPVACFAYLG